MSERGGAQAPTTGHWGREIDQAAGSEYGPLKVMRTYQEMKAEGGKKVEFEGTLYFREARNRGSFLGMVVDRETTARPVFVITGEGLPAIPHEATVRVRGTLADEPFANAG